jgi:hypothetical protein
LQVIQQLAIERKTILGSLKHYLPEEKKFQGSMKEGNTPVTCFHLDQSVMNRFICSWWLSLSSASTDPPANDQGVHLIGILLDEEHSLHCDIKYNHHMV